MKRLIYSVVALLAFVSVSAQPNVPVIPEDKGVRHGKLENGMTYFIRHNDKQKNIADFYIVHDVGAIQEADDQQGLAHFLEHMAFNGTKNLPGKTLINYLETVGVKFGANLNASTSWDVTQYLMKDVPTVREGVVDTAMLVLHDWSHFISLEPKEIDSERGVIMEELRTRDGASWRSTINLFKTLFKGTKYEHRNLIGYLDGLKSFDHTSLENFYHTWYRPEYQCVVIVGDIDVDKTEAKLKTLMSDIPASGPDVLQKEVIVVPDNKEPIVSVNKDPEMEGTSVSMYIKQPALPRHLNNTVISEQMSLIFALGNQMANTRLQEIALKPNAPFTGASIALMKSVGVCPTLSAAAVSARTKDGELLKGFAAVLTEAKRIKEFGFTEGEFERAKQNVLAREQRAYEGRNDRKNGSFVREYISAFRNNSPFADAETIWKIDSQIIANVPLQVINKMFATYLKDENQVIIADVPVKDGVAVPTEEDLLQVRLGVTNIPVEPYKDDVVKEPLIPANTVLKGSPVKSVKDNTVLDVKEVTLKNGLKIYFKKTDFKADEVIVSMNAHVGTCLFDNETCVTADMYDQLTSLMGVGKFSRTELNKQLSGNTARVGLKVNDYSTIVSGNSSPKDIETLLQLIYLNFASPRFNEDDFKVVYTQFANVLDNIDKNPDQIAANRFNQVLYGNNPRVSAIDKTLLTKFSYEKLPMIHKTLFSNALNFTVTAVGNIELDTVLPLIEKYLGSIPVSKKTLKMVDDGVNTVRGTVTDNINVKMEQPKVGVNIAFSGDIDNSLKTRLTMTYLSQALSSRYLESIREERGGTYSIRARGTIELDYKPHYTLIVKYDTNEKQVDELNEIVVEEIKKIASEGPRTEDIEKTREYLRKQWGISCKENVQWVSFINSYYFRGIDTYSNWLNTLNEITNDDVKALAKKVLDDNNFCKVLMYPEK